MALRLIDDFDLEDDLETPAPSASGLTLTNDLELTDDLGAPAPATLKAAEPPLKPGQVRLPRTPAPPIHGIFDEGRIGRGAVNAFVRGANRLPQAGGTFLEVAGGNLANDQPMPTAEEIEANPYLKYVEPKSEGLKAVGKYIEESGHFTSEFYKEQAEKFPMSEDLVGKNPLDNPEILSDPRFYVEHGTEMIPQITSMVIPGTAGYKVFKVGGQALKVTKAGVQFLGKVGAALFSSNAAAAQEAAGTFDSAEESYKPDTNLTDEQNDKAKMEFARASYVKMHFASMALNAISVGTILSKFPKSTAGKITKALTAEVVERSTEATEEIVDVLIRDGDMAEGIKGAATVFASMPPFAAGGSIVADRAIQKDIGGQQGTLRPDIQEALAPQELPQLQQQVPQPPGEAITSPKPGLTDFKLEDDLGEISDIQAQGEINKAEYIEKLRTEAVAAQEVTAPELAPEVNLVDEITPSKPSDVVQPAATEVAKKHTTIAKGKGPQEILYKNASDILEGKTKGLPDLNEQLHVSPISGLPNGPAMDAVVKTEEAEGSRFVVIEIDQFKFKNDTYGHDSGDVILERIGAVMKEASTSTQGKIVPYHLGGDKYAAIIKKDVTPEQEKDWADKVKTAASQEKITRQEVSNIGETGVTHDLTGIQLNTTHGNTLQGIKDAITEAKATDPKTYERRRGKKSTALNVSESVQGSPLTEKRGDIEGYSSYDPRHEATAKELLDTGDHKEIYDKLYTDPLTGLYNQRAWKEIASEAERRGHLIVAGDLVKFNKINKRAGFEGGDKVLKNIGTQLESHLARYGVIGARVGGDEINFIIPSSMSAKAADLFMADTHETIFNTEVELVDKDTGKVYTETKLGYVFGFGNTAKEADQNAYGQREAYNRTLQQRRASDESQADPDAGQDNLRQRESGARQSDTGAVRGRSGNKDKQEAGRRGLASPSASGLKRTSPDNRPETLKVKKVHSDNHIDFVTSFLNANHEQGGRVFQENENAPGQTITGFGSTYPAWFKGKGLTVKASITALKKYKNGKPLTENQEDTINTLLDGSLKDFQAHTGQGKGQAPESQEEATATATDKRLDSIEKGILSIQEAITQKPKAAAGGQLFADREFKDVTQGKIPGGSDAPTALETVAKEREAQKIEEAEKKANEKLFKKNKPEQGAPSTKAQTEKSEKKKDTGGTTLHANPFTDPKLIMDFSKDSVKALHKMYSKIYNPKMADNIVSLAEKENTVGLFNAYLGSPNRIGGKSRYYVVHAKNALLKQDRLRGLATEKLEEIFKGLSKEQVQDLGNLLFEGDAQGTEFTSQDLKDMGVSPEVSKSYLTQRKVHKQVYRLLNSHRRMYGGQMGKLEGHIPHLFENWNVYEMVETGDLNEQGELLEQEPQLETGPILATFRSMNEAIRFANKMDPSKQYSIKPKGFNMPDDILSKVVLSDSSFEKLKRNLEGKYEINIAPEGQEKIDFGDQGKDDTVTITREQASEITHKSARRKGKRRFLGNAMKRQGQSGFKKDDISEILKQYYYSVARYVALDDFKARAVPKFEKDFGVPLGRAKEAPRDRTVALYVERYIDEINGVPGAMEEVINKAILDSPIGARMRSQRPYAWTASKILHATGVVKLGLLNLSSGMVNLTQLTNTFSQVPVKHFKKAMKGAVKATPREKHILKRIGVEFDLGLADTGGHSMTHRGGKVVQGSMYFFSKAEYINRKVTALAGYYWAKESGKTDAEARTVARELVDRTQFNYSTADSGTVFRNPTGRIFGQFKPFAIKQLEFIFNDLKGVEHIKFWIPVLLISGINGIPLTVGMMSLIEWLTGSNPLIELKNYLMKWASGDETKKKAAEVLMYGVGSQFGFDISKRVGTGDAMPSELSDLLGPFISTIMQTKKAHETGDKTETVRAISPSVGNVLTAIEIILNDMKVQDPWRRQRLKYTATPLEVAIKASGLRPLREAEMSDVEEIRRYEKRKYDKAQQKAIDKSIAALKDGDAEKLVEVIQEAIDKGVILDDAAIEREFLMKALPQELRALIGTRGVQKPDYLEIIDFLNEGREQ